MRLVLVLNMLSSLNKDIIIIIIISTFSRDPAQYVRLLYNMKIDNFTDYCNIITCYRFSVSVC